MGCLVEDFLLQVLGVPLKLSPVDIHKGLGVIQAPAEVCLEFVPYDRDKGFSVMSPFVLLPAEADLVPQERRGKGNLGRSRSSNGSKIVLTLLTEVVVVYVGLSAVYVWGTGLQLLPGCLGNDGSWIGSGSGSRSRNRSRNGSENGNGSSNVQKSLKNPLQVILGILGDISSTTGVSAVGGFAPAGPAGWSDNLSPDSGGGEESGGATEGVMEGMTERCSQRGHLRPRTEVILELISSKTLFQTG